MVGLEEHQVHSMNLAADLFAVELEVALPRCNQQPTTTMLFALHPAVKRDQHLTQSGHY